MDIPNLDHFAPDNPLSMVLHHADGSEETITVNHTYNAAQIAWYRAGSALNLIRQQQTPD